MEERKVISNGKRWMRWIPTPVFVVVAVNMVLWNEEPTKNLIALCICAAWFYLFHLSRRLLFDGQHFYKVRGVFETIIPFSRIISIKKSRVKVNGKRYWKLLYTNDFGNEKLCRFFPRLGRKGVLKPSSKGKPVCNHLGASLF